MTRLPCAFGPLAFVAAALCGGAATAGQITATASQNPIGAVSNASPGSAVSARWNANASAEVTRTSVSATSLGDGVSPPGAYAASGATNTQYQLWSLASDAALGGSAASGLTLAFDFTLRGDTALPPVSLSVASVWWSAALYSAGISAKGGDATMVYGPIPPFPSVGYLTSGDPALMGAYDLSFSLMHRNAGNGLWTMGFGTSASHAGDAWGTLALSRIRLTEGTLPVGGLAVRLETGELITVSAVPEPAAHWMLLAGMASIGVFLRRRTRTA